MKPILQLHCEFETKVRDWGWTLQKKWMENGCVCGIYRNERYSMVTKTIDMGRIVVLLAYLREMMESVSIPVKSAELAVPGLSNRNEGMRALLYYSFLLGQERIDASRLEKEVKEGIQRIGLVLQQDILKYAVLCIFKIQGFVLQSEVSAVFNGSHGKAEFKHEKIPNSIVSIVFETIGTIHMLFTNSTITTPLRPLPLSFRLTATDPITVLPCISSRVKNCITHRLLFQVKHSVGVITLPSELFLHIITFLDVKSKSAVPTICRTFEYCYHNLSLHI